MNEQIFAGLSHDKLENTAKTLNTMKHNLVGYVQPTE
jgi:hypothetical protein